MSARQVLVRPCAIWAQPCLRLALAHSYRAPRPPPGPLPNTVSPDGPTQSCQPGPSGRQARARVTGLPCGGPASMGGLNGTRRRRTRNPVAASNSLAIWALTNIILGTATSKSSSRCNRYGDAERPGLSGCTQHTSMPVRGHTGAHARSPAPAGRPAGGSAMMMPDIARASVTSVIFCQNLKLGV